MKLKYYLRGLGIGMAVTALILGIASGSTQDKKMTDEEILSRAKELGLVERTVLSEISEQDEEKKADVLNESVSEGISDNGVQPETTPQSSESETSESQPVESESEEPESTEPESKDQVLDQPEGMSDEKQTVSVEIVRGDSSVSVSRKLKEAGLIEDDLLYDRFLCENGYDKRIQAKVYEIPINATESEIAELISGRAGTQ